MAQHSHSFIPAAGHDWLLPFYDPLNWLLGGDALRGRLIEQATLARGARVLDVGCGTGALTLLIKTARPDTDVVGIDPDAKALARARAKAERAHLAIVFVEGFGDALPDADASFDAAFSSLMLHHLSREQKLVTLAELRRVLKPHGTVHILDFGPPRGHLSRFTGALLHRAAHLADNVEGRIPQLMRSAGFASAEEIAGRNTVLGSMAYYRGGAQPA